jgi:hypothetical protein
MPPDKSIPGSGQDWLVRAKGHLALAKQPKSEAAFWEDQSFLAQQAAEKAPACPPRPEGERAKRAYLTIPLRGFPDRLPQFTQRHHAPVQGQELVDC